LTTKHPNYKKNKAENRIVGKGLLSRLPWPAPFPLRVFRSAIQKSFGFPRKFLPRRNTKSTKKGFPSLRSLAAIIFGCGVSRAETVLGAPSSNSGRVTDELRYCEHGENVNNFYRKCLPAEPNRAKNLRQSGMVVGWRAGMQ
jgi:hypothetical protein